MRNINTLSGLPVANFSKQIDGKEMALYTLYNKVGTELAITNYRVKIVSLIVPDRNGKMIGVVTSHNSTKEYLASEESYFGAICDHYGDHIAAEKFTINGVTYGRLAINNGPNSLHGGVKGLNTIVWDAKQIGRQTIELEYTSVDGKEGFPGELRATVAYHLTNEDEVITSYRASMNEPTASSLTNHSYFNLSGVGGFYTGDHILTVSTNYYPLIDNTAIPCGPKRKVEGISTDFRTPHEVGERINNSLEQLIFSKGYDHTYVLDRKGNKLSHCTRCSSLRTGIVVEACTTQPGV